MTLGMQIGHFRATLGAKYAASPEAASINQVAIQLRTALTLAFLRQEAEEEPDEEDDEELEHQSTDGVPAYYPTDFGVEEDG